MIERSDIGYELIVATEHRGNEPRAAAEATEELLDRFPGADILEVTVYDEGAGIGFLVYIEGRLSWPEDRVLETWDKLESVEKVPMDYDPEG